MKLLLIALLSTLGAVSLALIVRDDPGFVLIGVGDWTIETALSLFVIFLLLAFALAYFALRALLGLWSLPSRTRAWNARRRQRAARRGLTLGLLELTQQRWAEAEKRLLRSAPHSDAALLNYLGAARAAQQQGADERRDDYLRRADAAMPTDMPGAGIALDVTRAELHMAAEAWQQAAETLAALRERAGKHPYVLALSARVARQLGDWEGLNALLPALRRYKALADDELRTLTTEVRVTRLTALNDGPREQLEAYWLAIPKAERLSQPLLGHYLDLLPDGAIDRGLELIREALKHGWDASLAERYARLRGSNPNQQFHLAESWLNGRETDPGLLLDLGRLALRAQLWGKARSYLDTSVGLRPSAEGYRMLGETLLEIGDADGAARRFREGLALATGAEMPSAKVRVLARDSAA